MKKFVRILCFALVTLMLCATLASCGAPAKDPADAEAALEEAGYTVVNDSKALPALYKVAGYDLDNVVSGTKISKDDEGNTVTEHVTIYYFADKDNAEKAMEKIADDEKEEKGENENWVSATRSGSMVYFGTKQGVKDAK